LLGKDFEVTRIGVVEDHREYDFKIEFGLLQLFLFQPIKCDSPFGEFIISPVQNIKEIFEETKSSKVCDVMCHISFTFTSNKENLEKKITEIVGYLKTDIPHVSVNPRSFLLIAVLAMHSDHVL